ncbi:GNAT family N-acetyltransferase [Aequorivita sp. F47161]|uniref:GNAT family N-acetyltransferase n=1 Tax=Aequorivita vitellina TaxID=2874475 RepID=A0A9X1QX23_9FLAO|nr:GNAT family N-acetyltransferase [Aequorivita vitellina]MCG2420563.1 GNAT family N-acetyltransferase [Aequorivita vitellina]
MKITNSSPADIPEIFRLYRLATEYQKITFPDNLWPEFDRAMVETEVLEKRQFKIVIDGQVACVWAITYSDPQIWEEADNEDSIYIHRIATNPDFRGNDFVKTIVTWAKTYAAEHKKQYIRMDTCGNNQRLIKHYTRSGFNFLEMKKIRDSSQLPSHYHNADVCYFEIQL